GRTTGCSRSRARPRRRSEPWGRRAGRGRWPISPRRPRGCGGRREPGAPFLRERRSPIFERRSRSAMLPLPNRRAALVVHPLRAIPALSLMVALLAACAAAGEGVGGPVPHRPIGGEDPGGRLTLAPTDDRVKTVQLHPTAAETGLPVLSLGASELLTLSFDLLEDGTGRPLSVYFYHTDRNGRRDLAPSEYLRSFYSDDIR